MSVNHQDLPPDTIGQSPGWDPKASKRNSGLFAFLKWFKPSTSRESIDADVQISHSSSCDSLNSIHSTGTVASFSYVPPSAYNQNVSEKCIVLGPETDTYKARLKQRDKCRENDRNLTLRKKYNLFFNRETLLKSATQPEEEENTKSLPLMTRATMQDEEEKVHRRTNSESSKFGRAGAYLHVKGKRKAPQPPGLKHVDGSSTMSLKRKKRLAPPPPSVITPDKVLNSLTQTNNKFGTIEYADADVICNDSLKLDHGILKPAKETDVSKTSTDQNNSATTNSPNTSARSSYVEAPVSPRPWYKRNSSRDSGSNAMKKENKTENKYEPIERLPEVQFMRNSTLDLTLEDARYDKKKEEKRKSGLSFLTNISELDREASEIVKKEHQKNGFELQEIPEFMRPKAEPKINSDSWVSPKRRSARDLIAKFNAITNVTKVTVFGVSQKETNTKRDYFGKQTSIDESTKRQENLLECHKKKIEQIDRKLKDENKAANALMKSESVSAIKPKPETPKLDRKSWKCPKCSLENEYWRIICHVCSSIKPYFDDFSSSSKSTDVKAANCEVKSSSPSMNARKSITATPSISQERLLERSKTQIGFSALASYNAGGKKLEKSISMDEKQQIDSKREEKEKLKKMLIEMKNSLPKRKSQHIKQISRTSVIVENPPEKIEEEAVPVKTQEETVAEILIGTTQTIYENIKVKKTENPKPIKVSSSAQTSSVVKKIVPPATITNLIKAAEESKSHNYELMRPKDFENIYSDKNGTSAARIYANLAQNDELSLFFNMPKRFSDIKNNLNQTGANNTDTIEINRLLRRLETAIAKGELTEAAIFAKELAQLKINCSVIRQKPQGAAAGAQPNNGFQIEMFVEDKISHRGPFPIQVTENQSVAELKKQIEREFEIPANVQRWILGKELATDEKATLKDHNITTEGCPVFLYLVAPGAEPVKDQPSTSRVSPDEQSKDGSKKIEVIGDQEGVGVNDEKMAKGVEETKMVADKEAVEDHSPKIVNVIPKVFERNDSVEVSPEKIVTLVLPELKIEPKIEKKFVLETKEEQLQPKKIVHQKKSTIIETKTEQKTTIVQRKSSISETKEDLLQLKNAPKAKEEDFEDYDSKTLKPQPKEWECHLCTLLNPISSNICGVCATVRLNKAQVAKKSVKKKVAPQPKPDEATTSKLDETYMQLVNLDNADLVENSEPFECVVCFLEIQAKQGVTLRECLHQFCKVCLANTIAYTDEAQVQCPYRDNDYSCNIALQDREIKSLVAPTIYDQYLARSVAQAENKMDKSFHCKTPDCKGWCIFEDNVNDFRCPVCRHTNCLTCQAIHTGMNCKQYQEKMNEESEIDDDAKRTKEMLEEMVNKGEALTCPTCKVVLMKKWGCDWLRCSMCKTEICWVTRGLRWGPAGKGDTSGGCKCGVNGVKCHPQCNYCH